LEDLRIHAKFMISNKEKEAEGLHREVSRMQVMDRMRQQMSTVQLTQSVSSTIDKINELRPLKRTPTKLTDTESFLNVGIRPSLRLNQHS
jgi:hypothetical protein